jgi:hypothetical protein
VPVYDFAIASQELQHVETEKYYDCCGKNVCKGRFYSFCMSGNNDKCSFCNAEVDVTDEVKVAKLTTRVEANDSSSTYLLAHNYYHGLKGLQQGHLGNVYLEGRDMKKAKFHWEAAAMAGCEVARHNLGVLETNSGNMDQAIKHWIIAASGGQYRAMQELIEYFEKGSVTRESIESTLKAYNNSCAEMRRKLEMLLSNSN